LASKKKSGNMIDLAAARRKRAKKAAPRPNVTVNIGPVFVVPEQLNDLIKKMSALELPLALKAAQLLKDSPVSKLMELSKTLPFAQFAELSKQLPVVKMIEASKLIAKQYPHLFPGGKK